MFFNPDPYVKISIQPGKGEGVLLLPHHGQVCRTGIAESTTQPSWPGQVLMLLKIFSDSL